MTSLAHAVARAREDKLFAGAGPLRLSQLKAQFPHPVQGSLCDLFAAMRARTALPRPFAVIFCRFKGDPPHPDEATWETFFRQAFTRGTGGIADFWFDASLGKIDISGTKFFGWVEVDIARADAGWLAKPPEGETQVTRTTLTNAAIDAVTATGQDPVTGLFNQISLYMYGTTKDGDGGLPIDGSADGDGKINMCAPFYGDVTAHEIGHSLGLQHDADVAGDTNYWDPCCVMSQGAPFPKAPWNVNFGCPLCLPHLKLQKWMYEGRMFFADGAWIAAKDGVSFRLAPNSSPAVPAFLGASLAIPHPNEEWQWEYLLELVTATGWNRAVSGAPCLMIRRIAKRNDLSKPTAMFLAKVTVGTPDAPAVYHDPSGHTTFTVSLDSPLAPVVSVHAVRGAPPAPPPPAAKPPVPAPPADHVQPGP